MFIEGEGRGNGGRLVFFHPVSLSFCFWSAPMGIQTISSEGEI